MFVQVVFRFLQLIPLNFSTLTETPANIGTVINPNRTKLGVLIELVSSVMSTLSAVFKTQYRVEFFCFF